MILWTGSFFTSSSSSKALHSYGYVRVRFFDLAKNNLAHNITYIEMLHSIILQSKKGVVKKLLDISINLLIYNRSDLDGVVFSRVLKLMFSY